MVPMTSIYVGGSLTLLLAIMHCRFYAMFNWEEAFSQISQVNARILYTIHIALLLLFFLMGAISIVYAAELSRAEGLSFALTSMLSLFWLWRLVWQLFYFKRQPGQRIPPIGWLMILLFFMLFVSYGVPVVWAVVC